MKANEIFALARSILGERSSGYANSAFVPGWLNMLLVEALPCENSLRRAAGREPLAAAPVISSLEEVIDYAPELLHGALPYGLAFFFYNEDGERYQAQLMRNAYMAGLAAAAKASEAAIEDVYGGDVDA